MSALIRSFALVCLVSGFSGAYGAGVESYVYVAENGNDDTGDGSFENPYQTPAKGIAEAYADGTKDTVFLKAGTYPIDTVLTLDKPLTLKGEDRDTTIIKQTMTTDVDSSRVVSLTSDGVRVESLWLRDGCANNGGGNVYMTAGVVSNCVVSHGHSSHGRRDSKGSNVFMTGGTLTHSIVCDSKRVTYGVCGGGIAVMGPNVTIDTCLVKNNLGWHTWADRITDMSGGGIYLGNYTGIVVQNCTVVNNEGGYGGGIYSASSSAIVRNCIFADNTAMKQASSETGYPNMCATDPAAWGPCISRCVIGSGSAIGDNVRVADPLFVGDGDYHLASAGSPAVDWANAYEGQAGDLAGKVRGDKPDCGCYESDYHSQTEDQEVTVSFTPDKGLVGTFVSFNAVLVDPPQGESFTVSWKLLDANGGEIPLAGTSLAFSEQINTCGYFNVICEVQGTVNPKCHGKAQTAAAFHLVPPVQYVDSASANPSYPYDAPERAAKDFAAIEDELLDGTTVHVAAGTYNVTKTADIGDVRIFGAGVTDTILNSSASGAYTLVAMNHAQGCVSNLTLFGGTGSDGGSIRISGEGGTVSHCRIVSSSCGGKNGVQTGKGSAISCDSPVGLIDHCLIETNTVHGLYEWGTCQGIVWLNAGLMRNCIVHDNVVISNIVNSTGDHRHQAKQIVYVGERGIVENCTIADNVDNSTAASSLFVQTGGQVINTIVANNKTPNMEASTSTLVGLPNWQISAAAAADGVSNCCFGVDVPLGTAAQTGDPLFVDSSTGNYRIQAASPCYNRGLTKAWMADALDFYGLPRVYGFRVDIGAAEWQIRGFMILLR